MYSLHYFATEDSIRKLRTVLFWIIVASTFCYESFVWAYSVQTLLNNQFDPTLDYQTIKTPHFEIFYSSDLKILATELAPIVEQVHEKVTNFLGWVPDGKTDLVLIKIRL